MDRTIQWIIQNLKRCQVRLSVPDDMHQLVICDECFWIIEDCGCAGGRAVGYQTCRSCAEKKFYRDDYQTILGR